MKNVILMFIALSAGTASAIEVGDAVRIPASAVTCVDRQVQHRCFCEPPGTIFVHSADVTVRHEVAGVRVLTGTVGYKSCAEVLQSLTSSGDVPAIVTMKQVTERLHVPTQMELTLSLGTLVSITGSMRAEP